MSIRQGSGAEVDRSKTVLIPGGEVQVGTRDPVITADGEGVVRRKRIADFRMDAACVTTRRFAAFVDSTGFVTEAERLGSSFVFEGLLPADAEPTRGVAAAPWWREVEGATWRSPAGPGAPLADTDHPVTHVSWNDAQAFARWAGGRLPTEAEWEHAARGGLGDVRFPWGGQEPNDTDFFPCNIWQGRFPQFNSGADGYIGPAPAQSFEPNGYGLYNMVGNVWEWTSELFKVRSLSSSSRRQHKGKQGFRLSKGGSFLCHVSYCYRYRIAARTGTSPDTSLGHHGFRLVYDT